MLLDRHFAKVGIKDEPYYGSWLANLADCMAVVMSLMRLAVDEVDNVRRDLVPVRFRCSEE